MTTRNYIEGERLDINQKAIETQMLQQQAKVDQTCALAKLKQKQLDALKVHAGIEGVLVDLPLQVVQHVTPGTMLAKVVQPDHLIAELKIAETQARDVQIGEPAAVDTHNGTVSGSVMRVDPAVQNGTVTVDVKLTGELPKGTWPDLSVDGTIDLEKLDNLVCSLMVAILMRKLLFGVRPWDIPTFAVVGAALAVCTLLASYIPARRTAKVDPMVVLRYE